MNWKSAACRGRPAWAFAGVIALGALFLLRMLLIRYEAAFRALSPGCVFRKVTGLNCAGCGGTRAFFSLLKGDWAMAWRMNPLFMIGLFVGLLFSVLAVWDQLPGGRPKCFQWIRVTAKGGWIAMALILGFWVIRNIPVWPFTHLSPP